MVNSAGIRCTQRDGHVFGPPILAHGGAAHLNAMSVELQQRSHRPGVDIRTSMRASRANRFRRVPPARAIAKSR